MPEFISNTIQLHVARFNSSAHYYEYLVLQRSSGCKIYPSVWQTVTGTIEPEESSFDAAIRELTEETCLSPVNIWTLPCVTSFFVQAQDAIHLAPCFGVLVSENSEVCLSEEHQNYQWMNFDDAMIKLMLPSHKNGLRIFSEFILNNQFGGYFLIKDL